jgi:shikimate dehydrogenase
MRDMGFGGVNLTVPLKEVAFRALADLDAGARRLGAVNTVEMTADGLRGHNTDGDGFLAAVREAFGRGAAGAAVFVLGAGGAGRAVALSCAVDGAARVTLADLDAARARRLADAVRAAAPGTEAVCVDAAGRAAVCAAHAADLVVQCSPVGMRADDPSPLPDAAFRAGQLAFDLVYMYPRTAFMRAAEAAGARAANGLGMLLHQGARAYTLWTGQAAATAAMRAALEEAVYGSGT